MFSEIIHHHHGRLPYGILITSINTPPLLPVQLHSYHDVIQEQLLFLGHMLLAMRFLGRAGRLGQNDMNAATNGIVFSSDNKPARKFPAAANSEPIANGKSKKVAQILESSQLPGTFVHVAKPRLTHTPRHSDPMSHQARRSSRDHRRHCTPRPTTRTSSDGLVALVSFGH